MPTIVTRPDPPPDEPDPPAKPAPKAAPKMSKEEIAALLAVTTTNEGKHRERVGARAKRAALPALLLSVLLGYALGTLASLLPIAIGIAYSAWPLVTQKKSGWT